MTYFTEISLDEYLLYTEGYDDSVLCLEHINYDIFKI